MRENLKESKSKYKVRLFVSDKEITKKLLSFLWFRVNKLKDYACFLGAEISVFAESTTGVVTVVVSANVNEAKNAKRRNNLGNNFISSMYKDLFSYGHIFVKKSTFLKKTSSNAFIFLKFTVETRFQNV